MKNYRNFIIDASAFLAFIYKQEGWQVAAEYAPKSIMSAVSLTEVVRMLNNDCSKHEALELVTKIISSILPFDQEQAAIAGNIGLDDLNLGDRASIAASIASGFPVITANKTWKGLEEVKIIEIR